MVWALSLSTMKLSPHSLTPVLLVPAFEVWLNSVTWKGP
jgi:hypothetical protein